MRHLLLASAATVGLATAALAAPTVLVTYEAPGVVNTTASFDYVGVETFDSRAVGNNQSFSSDYGTSGMPHEITGYYSGVDIYAADVWGGAGNSNYAVTFTGNGYGVLNLATDGTNGINYFGYWLSALDKGNRLELLSNGEVVFNFNPEHVIAKVGACPDAGNPYCGNPVAGPNLGGNKNEPYVFVNFFVTDGTIDEVRFYENPQGGGYESDNHTVGYYKDTSGTPVNVPEPASLALLGAGLLGLGVASRRRRG